MELREESNMQKMHIPDSDKPTHLLYFIIKTHPFTDGNKIEKSGFYL